MRSAREATREPRACVHHRDTEITEAAADSSAGVLAQWGGRGTGDYWVLLERGFRRKSNRMCRDLTPA